MRDLVHAVALVAVFAGSADAENTVVQVDGAANTGVTQTYQNTASADPMPQPGDTRSSTRSSFFTEIRPGISLQTDRPRFSWRLAYVFSGIMSVESGESLTYTNQASLALTGIPSRFTVASVQASVFQGGNSFLLGQRAADMGMPTILAPTNANLVTANASEQLAWEVARQWSLQESVTGSAVAPQDDLSASNESLVASLGLDHNFKNDNAGIEARGGVSRLRPLILGMPQQPYTTFTTSLRARWNHDFNRKWNALATAGVGQVFTDTGSKPLAIYPVGSLALRYTINTFAAGVFDYQHDTDTNLQVGTVSLADRVSARGILTFDPDKLRVLSFSAGFLHNQPLGQASVLVSAATGSALQSDVGFTTALNKHLLATARYTIAYQFGQEGNSATSLVHILLVGITGTYSTGPQQIRPVPRLGQRVDGSDSRGFPVVDDPIVEEPPPNPPNK